MTTGSYVVMLITIEKILIILFINIWGNECYFSRDDRAIAPGTDFDKNSLLLHKRLGKIKDRSAEIDKDKSAGERLHYEHDPLLIGSPMIPVVQGGTVYHPDHPVRRSILPTYSRSYPALPHYLSIASTNYARSFGLNPAMTPREYSSPFRYQNVWRGIRSTDK